MSNKKILLEKKQKIIEGELSRIENDKPSLITMLRLINEFQLYFCRHMNTYANVSDKVFNRELHTILDTEENSFIFNLQLLGYSQFYIAEKQKQDSEYSKSSVRYFYELNDHYYNFFLSEIRKIKEQPIKSDFDLNNFIKFQKEIYCKELQFLECFKMKLFQFDQDAKRFWDLYFEMQENGVLLEELGRKNETSQTEKFKKKKIGKKKKKKNEEK